MTVTYVKDPIRSQMPPIPTSITDPSTGQCSGPAAITVDGTSLMRDLANSSQSSLPQFPFRDAPLRSIPGHPPAQTLVAETTVGTSKRQKHESTSGYDKSTIEAVQISVLIAMPQRPISTPRHTTESAGPLELGVARIPLGHHSASRWAARQSIRPPPQ